MPWLKEFTNACLQKEMAFHSCLKEVIIKSLLKKPDLNRGMLINYRAILNLPFFTKFMDNVQDLKQI